MVGEELGRGRPPQRDSGPVSLAQSRSRVVLGCVSRVPLRPLLPDQLSLTHSYEVTYCLTDL